MAGNIYSPKLDPITGFPIHTTPVRQSLPTSTPANAVKPTGITLYDGLRKEEFWDWWNTVKTAWKKIEVEDQIKFKKSHEAYVNSEYIKLCYAAQRDNQPIPPRIEIPAPAYTPKTKEEFLNFVENKLSGYALTWFRQEHHRYTSDVNRIYTQYQDRIQAQAQAVNQAQQELQQARRNLQENNAQSQARLNQAQAAITQANQAYNQITKE